MKMQASMEEESLAGCTRKGPWAKGSEMDTRKTLGFAHCAREHRRL